MKVLSVGLILLSIELVYGLNITQEERLINDLMLNYNPQARPVVNPQDTVNVQLSMKIIKVDELDTKSQYISVLGWVTTLWTDQRLTWNASDYGGLDYIALPPHMVWVPTYALGNTASGDVYNEFWYTLFKVRINSQGNMLWTPGGNFKAECLMDVALFPFDDQICFFKFQNWVYSGDKVNLTYTSEADVELLEYYNGQNEQWDIIGTKVIRDDQYFSPSTILFPHVYFGLHFQRLSLYYITNIVLISVMLAVLVCVMFLLPVESGERISMGVTLLLAFSVFILLVNEHIPSTSRTVPIIIIYIISFMAITTLGICESVLTLYFYHHHGDKAPPTSCVTHRAYQGSEDFEPVTESVNPGYYERKGSRSVSNGLPYFLSGTQLADGKRRSLQWQARETAASDVITTSSNDTVSENKRKWNKLSRCVDKIFFLICVSLFVLLVLVLLVLMPQFHPLKDLNASTSQWYRL